MYGKIRMHKPIKYGPKDAFQDALQYIILGSMARPDEPGSIIKRLSKGSRKPAFDQIKAEHTYEFSDLIKLYFKEKEDKLKRAFINKLNKYGKCI